MKISLAPRKVVIFWDGKEEYNGIVPTPFGRERAERIWAQRGFQWCLDRSDMTLGERAYVDAVWETMGGSTCWNDAFLRILRGTVCT